VRVPGKKFGNFLAQNLILPGTLAFYRIVKKHLKKKLKKKGAT
jgi:hypothetical protein